MRNIPEIKKMSTGLGSAKIHVQSSKGLCCEERRQEVEEEGYQSIPGPSLSQDNSSLMDHFLKHTHTQTHIHTHTHGSGSMSP